MVWRAFTRSDAPKFDCELFRPLCEVPDENCAPGPRDIDSTPEPLLTRKCY
jgi:hypothetical protein